MHRSVPALLAALCLAAAAMFLCSAACASAGQPAPIAIKSGLNQTRATIPIMLNGARFRCVLDTGSSAILVSYAVARTAHLPARGTTYEVSPDGQSYADRQTRIARFAAGGYRLRDVPALISSNLSGNDVLCGYDFFAHIPTLIDRSRQIVTLFPASSTLDRMRCLPIDLAPHVPLATVEINGAWVDRIVLDSGMVGGGALWDGVRPQLRRPLVANAGYQTDLSAVRNGLACGALASVRFVAGSGRSTMQICTETQRPDGYNGIVETNLASIHAMAVDYPHRRICLDVGPATELVSSRHVPVSIDGSAWVRFNRLRPPQP